MISSLAFTTAFAILSAALQQDPVQPLAEICGPNTANIVCINQYAAVMPYPFSRDALAWEKFEEDSLRTMKINDSSFTTLIPPAEFIIYDRERGLKILGENPTYEFIFNVSQNFHEAPVYVPTQNKLYSSQLKPSGFLPQYVIDLSQDTLSIETIELDPPLYAPNDAQYVNGSIYWAVAGGNSSIGNPPREQRPGIYKTDPATGKTICLLNNYFGYYFNGLNDLAVHENGDIWFTDTGKCRLCEVWLSWQSDRDQITHGGPISPRLRRKRTLLVSHRAPLLAVAYDRPANDGFSLPIPPFHRERQHRGRISSNGQRHRIFS